MHQVSVKPIRIEIPGLTPPSVNHYKVPVMVRTRQGRVKSFAITPEARAFQDAVAVFAGGRSLTPETKKERDKVVYCVEAMIVLGAKDRLDIDNGMKVLLDGLQKAGVIHSDARVGEMHVKMVWDQRDNPRTEIEVSIVEA